jgi:hypothetical protein
MRGPEDRWVAWFQLAEPLVWVATAWSVYAAALAARRGVRSMLLGVALGCTLGGVWAHRPVRPAIPAAPPAWADPVQRCARALAPPLDPVRILQWSLSGDEDVATRVGRVVAVAPDVAILRGAVGPTLGRALTEQLGGEFVHRPATEREDGLLILTRGTFHRCGDASHWSDPVDDRDGTTLLFVGTSTETSWPLVVGRLPAPWRPARDGPGDSRPAPHRAAGLAEVLDAPSVVVAMDTPRGTSARSLDAAMLGARLLPTAAAPNWPARIGPVPALPLHAWDRVWMGPAWRFVGSHRIPVQAGARDPVVTELHPQPVP